MGTVSLFFFHDFGLFGLFDLGQLILKNVSQLGMSKISSGLDASYPFGGRNTTEVILCPSQCIASGGTLICPITGD